MKKTITFFAFAVFLISGLHAQLTVNGTLDSSLSFTAGAGDYEPFSFGIEEFANIRFQSRLRDNRAAVYGAVNLIAAAGDYAANAQMLSALSSYKFAAASPMIASPYIAGENYIAALELERLYFRLNFEKANVDAGLFRLPFGYSSVWGSSDFLNPKNPLKPDARPRGVLGMAAGVFPAGDLKLTGFLTAPRDPFASNGGGLLTGLAFENHWQRASAQALYSFELPNENAGSSHGIHRAGLSLKADVEIGLVIDALYTYNHEAETEWDGLSLSAGIDYSFFDGKFLVLVEYLYNGESSSSAFSGTNLFGMKERNYIYSGFTFIFNDFTNAGVSLISCLDEVNFTPIIMFNHDLFQGASLMIMAQAPIDSELIDNGNFIMNLSARLRLRF